MQPRSQELLTDAAREAAPDLVAEVLRRFGRVRLRAYGGSMSPAIRPGDLLNVRHTPAEGVRRGDVVLFWRGGRLFAHRVVARTPGGMVTTRGDAHWHDDPAVPAEDVLGIVQSVLRKDKTGEEEGTGDYRSINGLVARLLAPAKSAPVFSCILPLLLFDLRRVIGRCCTRPDRRSSARA